MANNKAAKKSQPAQENKSKDKPGPIENSRTETPPSQASSVADAPGTLSQAPSIAPTGVRMPTINDVRVAGRLTRDPIIREVGNQKVANFDIAVRSEEHTS